MSVTDQRNLTFSINDSNTEQRRSIITENNKIKINKFDEYHENRKDFDSWFTQVKIYFVFNFVSNDKKSLFVSTFFKEKAKNWFKSTLKAYLKDNDENSKKICTNFEIFKKKIQRIFDVFNEEQTAKRIVQYLIQQTSAV